MVPYSKASVSYTYYRWLQNIVYARARYMAGAMRKAAYWRHEGGDHGGCYHA